MTRRKILYDYGRHYHEDKFVGWRVWKRRHHADESSAVAEFFGDQAMTRAKEHAAMLNRKLLGDA